MQSTNNLAEFAELQNSESMFRYTGYKLSMFEWFEASVDQPLFAAVDCTTKGSVTPVENHGPAVRDWTSLHASSEVRRARDDRACRTSSRFGAHLSSSANASYAAPAPYGELRRTASYSVHRTSCSSGVHFFSACVNYAAPAPTVYAAPAPTVEYIAPATAVSHTAPPFSVQISPAAMVSCAAPAPPQFLPDQLQ